MNENEQLELAIREEIDLTVEEDKILAECRAYLFDGKEQPEFRPEMTVYEMHALWDDGYERTQAWEDRWANQWKPIYEQLCKLNPRDRKGRAPLKAEIARLQHFGSFAQGLHEGEYCEAQMRFTTWAEEYHDRNGVRDEETVEAALEEFWSIVGDRPGIEFSWQWTLRMAIACALFGVTHDDRDPALSAYVLAHPDHPKNRKHNHQRKTP